jgi:Protein of unknown function (DUF1153)
MPLPGSDPPGWRLANNCRSPGAGTKRWVIRRKAIVVAAIRGGLLTLEEARSRYALTVDELLDWQYSIDRHGFAGLRITRIQKYPRRGRPSCSGTPV